jgi:hypothetical protein
MFFLRIAPGLVAVALIAAPAGAQVPSPALPLSPPLSGAPPVPSSGVSNTLQLSAAFTGDGRPVRSGLVWRVYEERSETTPPALVEKSTAATPTFSLKPGNYIVHAAYGFAGATRRVTVQTGPVVERLTISAGALKVGGAVADTSIPANRLSISVYVPIGNNSEGRLVVGSVKGGEIIRLPEGTYHVVSSYGESNAIMRADLTVEPGRITEATLNHRAATVTLKLVASVGGEAFAGTAFSVLTPGGDVIREAIGAFPSVTLAEGDYVLIARHEGQVHTREFKVESGLDKDIEVVRKN